MIYFTAIILSLVVSAQCVASGVVAGNITHLKNGREPNAGVSLFPMFPLFQLLALGIAWLLVKFLPNLATLVLFISFVIISLLWLLSYKKLKAELNCVMGTNKNGNSA